MKYICLGYFEKGSRDAMTEAEQQEMFDRCFAYDDHLRANGHWAGGEALDPPDTALTLYWKNGKVASTDGPYVETKELLGGFLILEARDMSHAVQLMSQHPALEYGSVFEIRPAFDMDDLKKASEQRRRTKAARGIALGACVLAAVLASPARTMAQDAGPAYGSMAPVEQYLMDRPAELALARSAAPAAISRDATVLVLGRQGYETAVQGTNGWVCMVERGWVGPFDSPDFWNPKIRGADCLNPPAARSVLPFAFLRTKLLLAGQSKADVIAAIKTALDKKELPSIEAGSVCYMMAKSSYLTDDGDHNGSHLMFYESGQSDTAWGANLPNSPVVSVDYWRLSAQAYPQLRNFPVIRIFAVGVNKWSDGTSARGM